MSSSSDTSGLLDARLLRLRRLRRIRTKASTARRTPTPTPTPTPMATVLELLSWLGLADDDGDADGGVEVDEGAAVELWVRYGIVVTMLAASSLKTSVEFAQQS